MSIGVTYDEFWHGDPELVKFAIAREEIDQRNRAIRDDVNAWNAGRYVMLAVGTVLSQAFAKNSTAKYPPEPMLGPELDEAIAEQKRERELRQMQADFLAYAKALEARNAPPQEWSEPA